MSRFSRRVGCQAALTALSIAVALPLGVTVAFGQADQSQETSAPKATDVASLLNQARQAMSANKLQEADALVRRAEAAGVRYPVLHFGDTPARVRDDLDKLLALQSGGQGPQKTNKKKSTILNPFAALGSTDKSATQDPFAGALRKAASGDVPAKAGETVQSAADTDNLIASGQPVGQLAIPQTSNQVNSRAIATGQLLAARRALVVGDVAQAQQHVQQAQQIPATYAASEDSPQSVLQAITEYQQLTANKDDSASWRQGYAKFLVSQANVLIDYGDVELAEQVATEAGGLRVAFDQLDTSPRDVLDRIARQRTGNLLPATIAPEHESIATVKQETMVLLAEARAALATGDLKRAEALAGQASRLNVADSQFAPQEDSPARLAVDLQRARAEAESIQLTTGSSIQELRLPHLEQIQEEPRMAAIPENAPMPLPTLASDQPSESNLGPNELIQQGEQALRAGNRSEALELFRAAFQHLDQLDPMTQSQLRSHLQMLSGQPQVHATRISGDSLLDSANSDHQLLTRQLSAEVGRRQSEAAKLRATDPDSALKLLDEVGQEVTDSELDENAKSQLLRRIELSVADTEQYIRDHKSELELDSANRAVLEDIERSREVKIQVQERMAELVDQFNALRDEHRYAEMEIVAKRAYDMAPEEPIAQQLWENAKFIRREMLNNEIASMTEEGVVKNFLGIRKSAAEGLLQGDEPINYGESWADLVKNRKGSSDLGSRRTARELEIERKLRTLVLPRYDEMPLSEVVEQLSQLTGVNIHLDARGLGQEGVRSDTPVSLNLGQEISLESALNLILEPLHLTYMIKDEVLKVTSEQLRDGDVYQHVYNVADLVVPIPNFVPSSNIGLQGLINDAYAAIPQGQRSYGGPMAVVPSGSVGPSGPGSLAPGILPQQFGSPAGSASVDSNSGPGGLGGAANADFDSLIDLIVSTVEFDSWMENGTGEGEIQPFPTNLSLVISQTQRVHEQIADLLEQLRRLQDLQVTIEVRFIRLTDRFFERIGIDFDFNIEDGTGLTDLNNINATLNPGQIFEPSRASATVGISGNPTTLSDPLPNFTVDLDVPFRDNSFSLAQPQFGGAQSVGEFGFAILSDIEAFFLINASQGDQRANTLSAPKVTLFNGQQAVVLDTAFRPFVISVIPVVGEFAAAQQPVIVVLSEGTMLTVQAVVSDDRRYVRLTLVPFFSQIGNVETFTFEGSETSSSSSNTTDSNDDGNDETNDNSNQIVRSGTTVQLPTFQVISVSTTVSVPDGGTVLLGGIKRLSEGRTEFGVPLLSKVPYVDRLFRNVGIGRDTESLMMMVTPHIIIQEEEEERLGIE